MQAGRSLEVGWGRGCRENDRNKCPRRGNQLNGKIDNMRFKGKEKTGGDVGNMSRLRVAIKHKRDQGNGKEMGNGFTS